MFKRYKIICTPSGIPQIVCGTCELKLKENSGYVLDLSECIEVTFNHETQYHIGDSEG